MGGGLQSALVNGLSGMTASQARITTTSNNIVNANVEGYTNKVSKLETVVMGGIGAGVRATTPTRVVDESKINLLKESTSTVAGLSVKEDSYFNLEHALGGMDSQRSLSGMLGKFQNAVAELSKAPSNAGRRNDLLATAQELCTSLRTTGSALQERRSYYDRSISESIAIVNDKLKEIEKLNSDITLNKALGQAYGDLEDQRDKAVRAISEHMNISTFKTETGAVFISTKTGRALVTGAAKSLSFTPTMGIDAGATYPSVIGPITIDGVDITTEISTGKIAAFVEQRDSILPKLQLDLDTLTVNIRDSVNDIHNRGCGFPPAKTLTGQRTFSTPTTPNSFTGTGTIRIAVINTATNTYVEALDFDLTTVTTPEDVRAAIDAMANVSATWSNNKLKLDATNATYGLALVSTTTPAASVQLPSTAIQGFSQYFGLNDFFITPDKVAEDGNSIAGITRLINVRSDILTTPSLISNGKIDASLPVFPLPTTPALYEGDRSVMQLLFDGMNAKVSFAASGNFSVRSDTLKDFANEIISFTALQANQTKTRLNTENEIQDRLKESIGAISGVNVQEQVTGMIAEQRLYQTSVAVIKASREMFDQLMEAFR